MYKIIIIYIFLFLTEITYAQYIDYHTYKHSKAAEILNERGEIAFEFIADTKEQINKDLTHIISIDRVSQLPVGLGYKVVAYASESQFTEFLRRNINFEIIGPVQLRSLKMADSINEMENWDAYPTYRVYENMMAEFERKYPELCRIDTILSSTPSGNYSILVAKISDNVVESENEPQFLYSSTIHGNETGGFILMLRLIDHLLKNYSKDQLIRELVDEVEIWICPLANPDGTYFKSVPAGSTIINAKRSNLLNVNLNRNYPDPNTGPHPDGNIYQAETLAFMTFADRHHFNMGANFHSGAELLNYPWDAWVSDDNPNADADWWEKVCTDYVDTARIVNKTYMTSDFADGVSEGGDWYVINGGRQDYMNFFKKCREVTIEIDNESITQTQNLNEKWNENYRSMLNFIRESTFGLRGIITDSVTGQPMKAMVWVNGYDQENDSSQVYSALPVGNYHKYMIEGNYNITFSASGYYPKTFDEVVLKNGIATTLNVDLVPVSNWINEENTLSQIEIYPNPASEVLNIDSTPVSIGKLTVSVYSSTGQSVFGHIQINTGTNESIDISKFTNGLYILKITAGSKSRSVKFQKIK